jgi:hypothetical protein
MNLQWNRQIKQVSVGVVMPQPLDGENQSIQREFLLFLKRATLSLTDSHES